MRLSDDLVAQLGHSPIFESLSLEARQRLAAVGTPLSLAHRDRLFTAGDPGDAAFLLISGELEVSLSRADGGETWLAQLAPGSVVGDMAILDGGSRSADVTATRASRLLRFGRGAVLEALASEPRATLELLSVLTGRLRSANALAEASANFDLGVRLARVLLQADHHETRSQSELARIVVATRESINRKIAVWRMAGWVDVGRQGIEILDRQALAATAQLA